VGKQIINEGEIGMKILLHEVDCSYVLDSEDGHGYNMGRQRGGSPSIRSNLASLDVRADVGENNPLESPESHIRVQVTRMTMASDKNVQTNGRMIA